MNKLCIAYNTFDGTEHLEPSIRQIRQFAHKIVIIFQKTSNFGLPVEQCSVDIVERLQESGLVDDVIEYIPKDFKHINNPYLNEMAKREIGLNYAKENGCNIYSVMDCDEYYISEDYKSQLDVFIASDCDASVVNMLTYYHSKEYVLEPPETYFVPVWYKINADSKFVLASAFPVMTDPTRKIPCKKLMILDKNKIVMHHMSYVRDNFESKFVNSSSRVGFNNAIGFIPLREKMKYAQLPKLNGVDDAATNIIIYYLMDYIKTWDNTKPAKTILTSITDWRTTKVDFWNK